MAFDFASKAVSKKIIKQYVQVIVNGCTETAERLLKKIEKQVEVFEAQLFKQFN